MWAKDADRFFSCAVPVADDRQIPKHTEISTLIDAAFIQLAITIEVEIPDALLANALAVNLGRYFRLKRSEHEFFGTHFLYDRKTAGIVVSRDATVSGGSAIVPCAVAVIEMPDARVGFEDSDAGVTCAIPVAGDGEHSVTAVVCYTGIVDASVEKPVAIEVEKPLARAGTEYADLGSQGIVFRLAVICRSTASAHTHAHIDCCGAGAAAGSRPTNKRGVCRRGSGEHYGRAAGVRTRASRATVNSRRATGHGAAAGTRAGDS